MMTHTTRPRCGLAMLTAIALVALVAVAMAAAASVFRLDLRRTAAALDDAQLRQLLLAGETAARGRLGAAGGGGVVAAADVDVALPPSLRSQGASLHLHIAPGATGATAEATVDAALAGRVARQTLRYERGPEGWRVTETELHADRP